MIAYLQGKLILKTEKTIVVLVDKIGYEIFVGQELLNTVSLSAELSLYIHTHAKENSLELYGLTSLEQWQLFRLLLQVSGIGPKSALSLANKIKFSHLQEAVIAKNPAILRGVYQVGTKTAERIINDLKGKIKTDNFEKKLSEHEEIIDVLANLGYREKQIMASIENLSTTAQTTEEKLKEALKYLAQTK